MNPTLTELCCRIHDLVHSRHGRCVIVGVVGLPGAGKTTLAEALVAALLDWRAEWTDHRSDRVSDPARPWIGSHVAHVPMDGFHLADVELNRLGRGGRKGAPDTFDGAGYAACWKGCAKPRKTCGPRRSTAPSSSRSPEAFPCCVMRA